MSSRFRTLLACLSALPVLAADPLRVCAEPNNMPYSNERAEGFENAIARVVAEELGRPLEFVWWAQRRFFLRHTLGKGTCDLMISLPADLPDSLTSKPYYRSGYAWVFRRDARYKPVSLEDAGLSHVRIGVHVVGEDYAPPTYALARRGIVDVIPFSLFGTNGVTDPAAALFHAVKKGDVDVAIAWGPQAAYFANQLGLEWKLIPDSPLMHGVPLNFDIAFGIRSGDERLREQVNAVIEKRRPELYAILERYDVPRTEAP